MMNSGMFSSRTDEWGTPQKFFDSLNEKYHFTLDPCADESNAKCSAYFNKEVDGLSQSWTGNVFMNPPYGREIGRWMKKAYWESQTNADVVVCLVPARTDTAWWHEYAMRGTVEFVRGRLKFGDGKQSAPFPSAVVVFKK